MRDLLTLTLLLAGTPVFADDVPPLSTEWVEQACETILSGSPGDEGGVNPRARLYMTTEGFEQQLGAMRVSGNADAMRTHGYVLETSASDVTVEGVETSNGERRSTVVATVEMRWLKDGKSIVATARNSARMIVVQPLSVSDPQDARIASVIVR